MDKVLTLDNWWDGPLTGLCTFGGEYCVFERIFSKEKDDWTDEYFLTPVDEAAAQKIIANYRRWCEFINNSGNAEEWKNAVDIDKIIKSSPRYRKFKKHALFKGEFNGCCDELKDYFVEWS